MIGGDLRVEKYRFRARPQKLDFVLFPSDHTSTQISLFSVIMLLCTICMGTGPFLMYENFFKCGVIETLLIIIIVMLLVQLSIQIYIRCWFYGTAYDYQRIWICVIGTRKFSFIPLLMNIIAYLTYVCRFGLEISKNGAAFLNGVWPNCPSFLKSKYFLLYVINILTAVPSLFVKNIVSLTWVAYVGNAAKIVVFICLLIMLVRCVNEMGFSVTVRTVRKVDSSFPFSPNITLFSSDPSALFNCVSIIMMAFFMHPMMSSIMSHMINPTVFRCVSSTWLSCTIFIFVFYGIGVVAYFIVMTHLQDAIEIQDKFNENHDISIFDNSPFNLFYIANKFFITKFTNRNVFFNFKSSRAEAILGQIACYVVTVTSNIIYTYFVATQVSSIVIDRKDDDTIPVFISGVVVILFSIGINFMASKVIDVLDTISIFALIILEFFLPPFYYLKLYRFTKPLWGVISLLVLVIGIALGVTCMYYKSLYLRSIL